MPRSSFVRGPRRATQWAGMGNDQGGVTLPSLIAIDSPNSAIISKFLILVNSVGLEDEQVTLTRMIGRLFVSLGNAATFISTSFAAGVVKARLNAIDSGTGALPDLEEDPDADWIAYISGHLENGDNVHHSAMSSMTIPFDIHSQRKLDRGESLVWVAMTRGVAINVGVTGRYLVKLT